MVNEDYSVQSDWNITKINTVYTRPKSMRHSIVKRKAQHNSSTAAIKNHRTKSEGVSSKQHSIKNCLFSITIPGSEQKKLKIIGKKKTISIQNSTYYELRNQNY